MKTISKYPKLLEQVHTIPGLRWLTNDLWFLQFKEPKKTDEFQRNNLLLEDEALLCGLKKKKFNEIVSQSQSQILEQPVNITEEQIYDNMMTEEDAKKRTSSSSSSSSGSSEDEELAWMISREFFCNH